MSGVASDVIGSCVGLFQVVLDYFNHDAGQNFLKKLNYGKFL